MSQFEICSEVTGTVRKITAQEGVAVEPDVSIMIVESMKMEIPVTSPTRGTVAKLFVREGDVVSEGQSVAAIAP